jgi:hypothetical protein
MGGLCCGNYNRFIFYSFKKTIYSEIVCARLSKIDALFAIMISITKTPRIGVQGVIGKAGVLHGYKYSGSCMCNVFCND